MAIAYDNSTAYTNGSGTGTTHTFAHTVTGTLPIIFVGCSRQNGSTDIVTGVTYAGNAMTRINTVATPGGNRSFLYFLRNPPTGANNVIISLSSSDDVTAGAISYTGAASTGAIDSQNTGTGSSVTSITTSTTTVADNTWLVGWLNDTAGRTFTAGANTLKRLQISGTPAPNACGLFDSNSAQTPAGSKSLAVTFLSDNVGFLIASFEPGVANPFIPKMIII